MTVTGINIEEKVRNYQGQSNFINSLKTGLQKYGRLTPKQFESAKKVIMNDESKKDSQKDLNLRLVGNTIKIGRKVAIGIKENYNLEFHPILVDVTEVMTISNKAFKLKAKLTKENGGICRCCGRTLTDEMSQVTGIGPVCTKYVGIEHPKTKDDVEQFKVDMSNKIDEIGEFEFWIPKRAIIQWNGTAGVMMRW